VTIAVFGATGHLGALTIRSLLAREVDPHCIVALGRNSAKLAPYAELGVEQRIADFDAPDTITTALAGVDTVVLVSSNDLEHRQRQHHTVISAAANTGVQRIVYTSVLRADTTTLAVVPDHLVAERELRESGIDYTILRNGWYTENYEGLFQEAVEKGTVSAALTGARISSARRADYAEAAAVVASTPGHDRAVYELGGDQAWTLDDFAAAASTALGRPVAAQYLTDEEEREHLAALGTPAGVIQFASAISVSTRAGDLYDDTHTLSRLIGHPTAELTEVLGQWV